MTSCCVCLPAAWMEAASGATSLMEPTRGERLGTFVGSVTDELRRHSKCKPHDRDGSKCRWAACRRAREYSSSSSSTHGGARSKQHDISSSRQTDRQRNANKQNEEPPPTHNSSFLRRSRSHHPRFPTWKFHSKCSKFHFQSGNSNSKNGPLRNQPGRGSWSFGGRTWKPRASDHFAARPWGIEMMEVEAGAAIYRNKRAEGAPYAHPPAPAGGRGVHHPLCGGWGRVLTVRGQDPGSWQRGPMA